MAKIGVYLCECGGNISNTIDLGSLQTHVDGREGIEIVRIYGHVCSGAGQKMIVDDVKNFGLDRVVIASCSPQFHEKTFRSTMIRAGLNPWLLEIANFREHCSWAHKDAPSEATAKAVNLLDAALARVVHHNPLNEKTMQMGDKVLVIGGGIAGIQTALELAYAGKKVTIVEKEPTLGGKMARLTKTFPTEDCAACIISPKMAEIQEHPNITMYTNAEIENLSGHRLHFEAVIRQHPRYVSESLSMDDCLVCGKCLELCPVAVPDEWEQGILPRKAIYVPADLAIPFKYLIDREHCLHFTDGSCRLCQDECPQNAIEFDQTDKVFTDAFDAVVVATGFDIFDATQKPVFGFGEFENVVTTLTMERIIEHIGDEPVPREVGDRVAFVQCVGSRDEQVNREYCSRVCCMVSVKLASLLKQAKPETDIYIFYTDLRAFGKGYEEYYKRAQQLGVKFVRGKPALMTEDPDTKKVSILVEDTLSRQVIEADFDLVVLANGLDLSKGTEPIVDFLKLAKSPDGFLKEAHPKYKPVDTQIEGVFIAGAAQGPKDIPDTVTQACAAACRVIGTLAQREFTLDPVLAYIDPDRCDGCKACIAFCPKRALFMNKDGIAEVNEALCVGCGACITACPREAIDLHSSTNDQLYALVGQLMAGKSSDESRVLIFADDNCTYRMIDALGVRKMKYPTNTRVVRVPSGARIQPHLILFAFAMGADSVLIGDCPVKSSRFGWANDMTRANIASVRESLRNRGVVGERVYFAEYDGGALARFVKDINEINESIRKSGTIPDEVRQSLL